MTSDWRLCTIDEAAVERLAGHDSLVLLHALSGFVDAGSAVSQAVASLRDGAKPNTVVEFDADHFIDYRARRPRMTFDTDRFTDVELPRISIEEINDADGNPYLLFSGPEPDVLWQAFTREAVRAIDLLNVKMAVGLLAVPWAAPHTRPVGLTPFASDRRLISGRPRWVDDIEIPGSADSLLHLRLSEAGVSGVGFAAHVPHYLTSHSYPPAAVALLEAAEQTTGLRFDYTTLRAEGSKVLQDVDKQVSGSEETQQAIAEMEQSYDRHVAGEEDDSGLPAPHLPDDELVGQEKLAEDFEAYLRDLGDDGTSQ